MTDERTCVEIYGAHAWHSVYRGPTPDGQRASVRSCVTCQLVELRVDGELMPEGTEFTVHWAGDGAARLEWGAL